MSPSACMASSASSESGTSWLAQEPRRDGRLHGHRARPSESSDRADPPEIERRSRRRGLPLVRVAAKRLGIVAGVAGALELQRCVLDVEALA